MSVRGRGLRAPRASAARAGGSTDTRGPLSVRLRRPGRRVTVTVADEVGGSATRRRAVPRDCRGADAVPSPAVLGLIHALGPSWLDPDTIISDGGLYVVLAIVFAECGLLIGFFLPGDSLLFTAGLLVSDDVLDQPLWLVCVLISDRRVRRQRGRLPDRRKAGPAVFNRPDSRLFRREYVDRTAEFFERYGGRRDRARPLRADRADVHHGDGRREPHGLPPLPALHRHRRRALGHGRHAPRLLARPGRLRARQHRGDPARRRRALGRADRAALRAGLAARPPGGRRRGVSPATVSSFR